MEKDFITATPDTGGAGTTQVTVTAEENTGSARTTSLNVGNGQIARTVAISQAKELVECNITVKWMKGTGSDGARAMMFEAYCDQDVASNLQVDFTFEQADPTGEFVYSTPISIFIGKGDNQSGTYECPYYDYAFRFKDNTATISPAQDSEYYYSFVDFESYYPIITIKPLKIASGGSTRYLKLNASGKVATTVAALATVYYNDGTSPERTTLYIQEGQSLGDNQTYFGERAEYAVISNGTPAEGGGQIFEYDSTPLYR